MREAAIGIETRLEMGTERASDVVVKSAADCAERPSTERHKLRISYGRRSRRLKRADASLPVSFCICNEWIYFLADEHSNIKIGVSNNPERRRKEVEALRAGGSGAVWPDGLSPSKIRIVAVVPGNREVEAYFHEMFQQFRFHCEWFSPAPSLVALISDIQYFGAVAGVAQ